MFHVYILRSTAAPAQIYIGFSSVDMATRLERHNAGSTPATARCEPWQVAWHCSFSDKQKAMDFEAYLKSGLSKASDHRSGQAPPCSLGISGQIFDIDLPL
jgi:predicted GIY-YIG superfamily endonuclease